MSITKKFEIIKIILIVIGIYIFAKIANTFVLFVAIALSIISPQKKLQPFSSLQDESGYKQIYHLPDGCAFTIWEKEPGKHGSEVLIIPDEYKKKRTPNISHIKTKFDSHTPTLLYHLVESYSSDDFNERFKKNKIFLKIDKEDSKFSENLYEIVNVERSNWEITIYSDNNFNEIFMSDSINSQIRNDISFISIDIDNHFIDYQINHWLYYVAPN